MGVNLRAIFVAVVVSISLTVASLVGAQPPQGAQPSDTAVAAFALPWGDRPPVVDGSSVRAAAIGIVDSRIGRFSARRAFAHTRGEQRARSALHRWADEHLRRRRVSPLEARAVHAAIESEGNVIGVRPLADGGAVVVIELPLSILRRACDREGLPWHS